MTAYLVKSAAFVCVVFILSLLNVDLIQTISTTSHRQKRAAIAYNELFPRTLPRHSTNSSLAMKIMPNSFLLSNQEIGLKHEYNTGVLAENLLEYCRRFSNKNSRGPSIKEDCFADIESLDFSANKLAHFPSNLTRTMFKRVKRLNLSNNAIQVLNSQQDFGTMLARTTLETLDLSANQLTSIDEETFKYLSTLKHLNLANNKIKFINLFAFAFDTHHLVELDLGKNFIEDTSMEFLLFSSLAKLTYLNLNENSLTTLSNHLLYNLYSLEYLSLSRNKLKTFDLFSLNKNNEFLRIVDLSFNSNLEIDHNLNDPRCNI